MDNNKPSLFTCLSPALLHLYDVSDSIVVIIDILRATSTITMALHNGAVAVIPVDSVEECIRMGAQTDNITAGERDGRIAEGLKYGNSPFEYPASFIKDKTLVLTTTNGTKLLHMALERGAAEIITGSFGNLDAVCTHLVKKRRNIILACAAWKGRVNIEDTLFAGAVIKKLNGHFNINCDASQIAETLYVAAKDDLFAFMKDQQASHYTRLLSFGLEKDIRFCLQENTSSVLPVFAEGKLISGII